MHMKEKLFESLKQAYSHLGLGDDVLQAYAVSLDTMGIVTEDNIQGIVAAQKSSLEAFQKANDKRAASARKAAEEAEKKRIEEEAAKKKAEEVRKAAEETEKKRKAEEQRKQQEPDEPEWFKAYKAAEEERLKEVLAKNEELSKTLSGLKDENDKFKAEQATAKRNSFIASEAKRLGVPEWRTSEGFNISPEMDDAAITEYISKVANNVKANMLPEKSEGFPKFDGNVSKESTDALADKLLSTL